MNQEGGFERGRSRANLIGQVVVVLFVALGFWLMRWLAHYEQVSVAWQPGTATALR